MSFSYFAPEHGLAVTTWEAKVASQYLRNTFWFRYAGMDDSNIIHIKENLVGDKGMKFRFGIRSRIIGGLVRGANQGIGNEGEIEYYHEEVSVDMVRRLVKKENVELNNQAVAFALLEDVRPALSEENQLLLDSDITEALTDVTTGRHQGRYLYGGLEANWSATHSTALANITSALGKQSTTMIEDAMLKAKIPGYAAHAKIRPWKVVNGAGNGEENWYLYVMHDFDKKNMIRNDAAWKNAHLNIPPQSNMKSPIFSGSTFMGAWEGALLYAYEGIPLLTSTTTVSHCLLLGAQAGVLAWAQHVKFGHQEQDLGHTQIYETAEIRGLKKVVYKRNAVNAGITDEDNGIIHVFTAAV